MTENQGSILNKPNIWILIIEKSEIEAIKYTIDF